MPYHFPITKHDGHLLIQVNGLETIIDTGAPTSVSTSSSITMGGQEFQTSSNYFGITPDTLSGFIGRPVNTLLGMDVLSHFEIEIQRNPAQLVLNPIGSTISGETLAIDSIMDLPGIKIEVGGKAISVVFDTGAKLTYLPRESVEGLPRVDTIEDFYPGFGRFSTPVYRVPFRIGGHTLELSSGVLPELLEATLLMNLDGIVGTELLKHFDVGIAMQQGSMLLAA